MGKIVIKSVISNCPKKVTPIWLKIWVQSKFYYKYFCTIFSAKIPFFSIENGKIAVTKPVISHKPLHVTAIWLNIWQIQTILKVLTQSTTFYDSYPRVLSNTKISNVFSSDFEGVGTNWNFIIFAIQRTIIDRSAFYTYEI